METEENFKQSNFTIKVKLIAIISIIIISSLSLMIFLASYFFRSDSEKRIQETTLNLTTVTGQKIQNQLSNLFHNLRVNALLMQKGTAGKTVLDMFYKTYPNVFYFGVGSSSGTGIRAIQESFNKDFMQKEQISIDQIRQLHALHSPELTPALAGANVVINSSPGFTVPAYAIALPLSKLGGETNILFAYSGANDFLDSFSTSGITTTYMVSAVGAVIAHPDERLVLANADISKSPIVEALLSSKVDNGQTRFQDEDNIFRLGSFKKLETAGLGIISTVPEKKAMEEVENIQRRNIIILVIVLATAVLIVFFYSLSLSTPIVKLVDATHKIENGDFKIDLIPTTRDEIGSLTNSFIKMGEGLEEREKVKQILGSMIDPIVVEEAMKDLAALKRGAERNITAFFSDVASFSAISEKLQSVDLASLLNEYLSAMTIILKNYDGVLDKYIGDAIVGIWNAPIDVEDHTLKAAQASVEMVAKLKDLREYWTKNNMYIEEAQRMDARIGLNVGPAKTGFMGTDALASFTMMGDTVNLAARLEAAGKDYGANILISESVYEKINHALFCRRLDKVRVKGKNEPVTIYELIGKENDFSSSRIDSAKEYMRGFDLYLNGNFDQAISLLERIEKIRGEMDKASVALIERCKEYLKTPPPSNWDGAYTRTKK